jgi:GGDEF domain-containing protein
MSKRFWFFFLVATGVFFVVVVGLTGYRIESARERNAIAARQGSSLLADKASSLRDMTGGFDAPQFKADMRALFTADPRLLLVCIHSSRDGIQYFIARDRSYLVNPAAITASWRGTPAYRSSRGYDLAISASLPDAAAGATMDSLWIVMGREDLYPVIRDDLYLFLAFLLVCGVGLLIFMSVQQEPARGTRGAGGADGPAEADAAGGAAREPAAPRPASSQPGKAAAAEARQRPAPQSQPREASGTGLVSERTGLVWAEHLEPRLKTELERASSSDQDLAFARIRIDEPFVDARLPLVYAEVARILKDSYPLHDLIFETGSDGYSVLLPETDVDAAVRVLDKFRLKAAAALVEGKTRTVSVGVSARGGRLIEDNVLVEEADIAVAKASREGGNQVIGFRADAARFRDALNGRLT